MTPDQVFGLIRTLVPALVAYLVGRGYIPEGAAADVAALILAIIAAGWSWYSNSRPSLIKAVAAMPGTTVSAAGNNITIVDKDLADAARSAATPA